MHLSRLPGISASIFCVKLSFLYAAVFNVCQHERFRCVAGRREDGVWMDKDLAALVDIVYDLDGMADGEEQRVAGVRRLWRACSSSVPAQYYALLFGAGALATSPHLLPLRCMVFLPGDALLRRGCTAPRAAVTRGMPAAVPFLRKGRKKAGSGGLPASRQAATSLARAGADLELLRFRATVALSGSTCWR